MKPQPRLVLIETSGRAGQVAVAEGPELRGCRQLDEARRHARDLAPALADLLRELRLRPGDIQAVIVSRGPGSYTGLRVGIASAQALVYGTGSELIAVDTFAVVARQAPAEAQALVVLADAQQDRVYLQSFGPAAADGGRPAHSDLRFVSLSQLQADLPPETWLTGPGLQVYGPRLSPPFRLVGAEHWTPGVASLLAIGLARYEAGAFDDLRQVEPHYARPSAAELQVREGQGRS